MERLESKIKSVKNEIQKRTQAIADLGVQSSVLQAERTMLMDFVCELNDLKNKGV